MPHRFVHQVETGGAVALGVASSILTGLFTEINLVLFVIWACAVVVDLAAGLWRTVARDGWRAVSGRVFWPGLAKKVGFAFFVLAAGIVDSLAFLIPAIGAELGGVTVTTKLVLVSLILMEVTSITRNAVLATGESRPGKIIEAAVRHIRGQVDGGGDS